MLLFCLLPTCWLSKLWNPLLKSPTSFVVFSFLLFHFVVLLQGILFSGMTQIPFFFFYQKGIWGRNYQCILIKKDWICFLWEWQPPCEFSLHLNTPINMLTNVISLKTKRQGCWLPPSAVWLCSEHIKMKDAIDYSIWTHWGKKLSDEQTRLG